MGKKKGAIAAKARARREQRNRSPSPQGSDGQGDSIGPSGTVVPSDGRRVRRGLANLGNTCFMNSVLQCLNVSLPFSDELLSLPSGRLGDISAQVCATFRGMRGSAGDVVAGKNGAYSPQPLRQQLIAQFPWYRGKQQHDAHEFLRTLLGSIADDVCSDGAQTKAAVSDATTSATDSASCSRCVSDSFRGSLFGATLCWGCKQVSVRFDHFLDVSLDLPALHGQRVGALGLTPDMESGTSSSSKPCAGQEPEAVAEPSASEPTPRVLKGACVASRGTKDAEEFRESARKLVDRVIVRELTRSDELAEFEGNSVPGPELPSVEIELNRQAKRNTSWGFRWSDPASEEGAHVLCGIGEDSLLEKWNLRCRGLGDDELVICIGDRLVEVNDETSHKAIDERLKNDEIIKLRFVRGAKAPKRLTGSRAVVGQDESDGEIERKAELAAARERSRREFCDEAAGCREALPPALQDAFGPDMNHVEINGRFRLEDCLRRFSVVEVIEDKYKPTYQCSSCKKDNGRKTFASRRMWLWPEDLPPILTLQLKRFRRYFQQFEKSVATVELPLQLDLADFVLREAELESLRPHISRGLNGKQHGSGSKNPASLRYELYGLCVHQGVSMRVGHYVAFVNNGSSLEHEDWLGISDAKVWSCTRAEVLQAQAYVAFYRREGTAAALPKDAVAVAETCEAAEDTAETTEGD